MFVDIVEFTLPGSHTPEDTISAFASATKAVEFTRAGRTEQAGYVTNFQVTTHSDASTHLTATLYADGVVDYSLGTLSVSGWSGGTLTVSAITQPQHLPLLF